MTENLETKLVDLRNSTRYNQSSFWFADTETTGLNPANDRITQLALVRCNILVPYDNPKTAYIYIGDVLDYYIHYDNTDYDWNAVGLTKDNAFRKCTPDADNVDKFLSKYYFDCENPLILTYNTKFDSKFIQQVCKKNLNYFCLME